MQLLCEEQPIRKRSDSDTRASFDLIGPQVSRKKLHSVNQPCQLVKLINDHAFKSY